MAKQIVNDQKKLFTEISKIIEDTRQVIGRTVNTGLTILYWNIGKRINEEVLNHKRAKYGSEIISLLSNQLTEEYGKGYSKSALTRMRSFHEKMPDYEIVATLSQQLTWSHFIERSCLIMICLDSDEYECKCQIM